MNRTSGQPAGPRAIDNRLRGLCAIGALAAVVSISTAAMADFTAVGAATGTAVGGDKDGGIAWGDFNGG